jgi:hypothetical protein
MSAAANGPRRAAANNLPKQLRKAAVVTGWVAAAVAVSACGDNIVPAPDAPPCMMSVTSYGTIASFTSTNAVRTQDGAGNVTIAFLGALGAGPTADTLDIQLIQGMGAFAGGPPAAGTYMLTGPETQLSTCGTCVVIEAGTPRSYFAAQRGTLTIEQLDTSFKASLANVELAHVEVDPMTSVSTIVDSCTTSITAASWVTPVHDN